jgi:hypothetical protein
LRRLFLVHLSLALVEFPFELLRERRQIKPLEQCAA